MTANADVYVTPKGDEHWCKGLSLVLIQSPLLIQKYLLSAYYVPCAVCSLVCHNKQQTKIPAHMERTT